MQVQLSAYSIAKTKSSLNQPGFVPETKKRKSRFRLLRERVSPFSTEAVAFVSAPR